ncbi:MAG: chromosome segregation protein SMC [Clostridiales bacterium]|nr:chromosome segregation protein SMC [Clostridiales bacterium]
MNLKRVEMVGFKSFADYQKIDFEDGITAIVGPNGCGKSNVSDAIRWVLGEQSSKNLRGQNMQDVIFKGTEKRKGLSFCEVSLVFDNTNKMFNSEYDEIIITRKLYRSGESEYLLNKTQSRLKDIVNLLHDSGIGKNGYSIIGQGMVGKIVNSKPEERRAIFEEAAGIAKFKNKKTEAERKLLNTQDNLNRINDLITEIDRQLKPLKEQAETAKIYHGLKDELKVLEVNHYIHQYDTASDTKNAILEKTKAIEEELNYRIGEKEKADALYSEAFDRVGTIDADISTLKDKVLELNIAITKHSGELNVQKEKYNYLKAEDDRLSSELDRLRGVKDTSQNSLYEVESSIKDKQVVLLDKKSQVADLNEKYDAVASELKSGEDEADAIQQRIIDNLELLGDVKAQISALNAEKNSYQKTLNELEEQIQDINIRFSEAKSKQSESSTQLLVLKSKRQDIDSGLNEKIIHQDNLQIDVKRAENVISELGGNILSLENRKKMLEEYAREYEGFNGTIKRLLTDAEKNNDIKSKIIGVLASLIKVPSTYQTAIETALGNAVQNIVTASDEHAKYLINYLKQRDYGRATFLPINSVKPRRFDNSNRYLLDMEGCLGLASELIEYDSKLDNIISSLLGTTIIVNNMNSAINIARKCNYAYRMATLDGDIISPQGSLTGGSKKAQVTNLLGRQTEIENCGKLIAKLTKDKTDKVNECEELVNNLKDLNSEIKTLSDELHSIDIEIAQETERFDKFTTICNDYENERNRVSSNIGKNKQVLEGIINQINRISDVKTDIETTENIGTTAVSQFSELKNQKEEYSAKITTLKVEIATLESELVSLDQERQRLVAVLEGTGEQLDILESTCNRNRQLLNVASNAVFESETSLENNEAYELLKKTEGELEKKEEEKSSIQEDIRRLDDSRTTLLQEVNILQDKKYKQEMALAKVDTDIETMQERVWTEYGLTYDSALELKDENYDAKMGNSMINKVKKDIVALGHINERAIEDCQALEERFGKMYNQSQDLIKAEADLKRIIKDLSNEMIVRFQTEFDKINTNFGIVFKELFGGGSARLEIMDSEDQLEAGIDIKAEPPEKKLSNISLLSGGEQALVAIAILFAILRLRPLPFCLLDEIEAPLDEANVTRLAKYLKRYSHETQFIVITHKKPTMENADTLFGVTMEEKGVSKLVSVKLSDAIKNTEQE